MFKSLRLVHRQCRPNGTCCHGLLATGSQDYYLLFYHVGVQVAGMNIDKIGGIVHFGADVAVAKFRQTQRNQGNPENCATPAALPQSRKPFQHVARL